MNESSEHNSDAARQLRRNRSLQGWFLFLGAPIIGVASLLSLNYGARPLFILLLSILGAIILLRVYLARSDSRLASALPTEPDARSAAVCLEALISDSRALRCRAETILREMLPVMSAKEAAALVKDDWLAVMTALLRSRDITRRTSPETTVAILDIISEHPPQQLYNTIISISGRPASPAIREAAQRCLMRIAESQRRITETSRLLRPAAGRDGDDLLRPVSDAPARPTEYLLHVHEDPERPTCPADHRV